MKLIIKDRFYDELVEILEFIQKDSISRKDKFRDELYAKLENIPFMPYAYPKNRIANKDSIRNLISKGYIIPFAITDTKVEILGIYKHNEWKL